MDESEVLEENWIKSKGLDDLDSSLVKILGEDLDTAFVKAQMKILMQVHVQVKV